MLWLVLRFAGIARQTLVVGLLESLMRLINWSVYSLEIFEEHPGCLCNVVFVVLW